MSNADLLPAPTGHLTIAHNGAGRFVVVDGTGRTIGFLFGHESRSAAQRDLATTARETGLPVAPDALVALVARPGAVIQSTDPSVRFRVVDVVRGMVRLEVAHRMNDGTWTAFRSTRSGRLEWLAGRFEAGWREVAA